jgi:hypothetical protein
MVAGLPKRRNKQYLIKLVLSIFMFKIVLCLLVNIQIKADFSLDFDQNYFENSRICEIQIKILVLR